MNKFKEFYLNQKERLFGYLLRRTGNYHLSEDIMQETFTKYLESYQLANQNPALLFTISRNLLTDQFRKQRPELLYDENNHSHSSDLEGEYVLKEESRRVLNAIQQLAKLDADILALAVAGNFSYQEISQITQLTETNVKVRIHRSRIKLKKILEQT